MNEEDGRPSGRAGREEVQALTRRRPIAQIPQDRRRTVKLGAVPFPARQAIGPAGDMAAIGLATAFVPSARLAALAAALERPGDVAAIIGEFAAAPPLAELSGHAGTIARAFADPEPAAVAAALRADGSSFARELSAMLAAKSPTSVAIALRQMRHGGEITFEEAMRLEYRIVSRVLRGRDFYEGVRAAIVDKDNRPTWLPGPSEAELDLYFAPLGPRELAFSGGDGD